MSKPPKLAPPLRKNGPEAYGTAGRPIKLITNFFPVTIKNTDITLVHYDVTIKNYKGNDKIPKRIKKEVFAVFKSTFAAAIKDLSILAYDGEKNAYSVNTIEQLKKGRFVVSLPEEDIVKSVAKLAISAPPALPPGLATPAEGKKKKKKKGKGAETAPADEKLDKKSFSMDFKKVDSFHLSELLNSLKQSGNRIQIPTQGMNMLEVMFRQNRAERFMQIGRCSFFSKTNEFVNPWDLGAGKEGTAGFFASLRPAVWKNGSILLNIDKSHSAFYKEQSVMDFAKENLRDPLRNALLDPRSQMILQKEIKGIKVRVQHSYIKRTYRVNGVTKLGADKLMFKLEEDGKPSVQISVQEYFSKKYDVRLGYPKLNCLHVGNPDKKIHVPIELCRIEKGQRVTKKLSDQETASFIRKTAVPPADRLSQIMNMAKSNNFKEDNILNALTFSISDQPLRTTGRVLPDPNLGMNPNVIKPRQGVWDLRNCHFYQSKALTEWVVLNFAERADRQVEAFISKLQSEGRRLGMNIIPPREVTPVQPQFIDKIFPHLKNTYKDLQLIICVLDRRQIYANIKKAGDHDVNVITQCVMSRTLSGRQGVLDGATVVNILMKINAKIGGVNNIVQPELICNQKMSFDSVLVMGADVNHPPAGGSTSMPSIAAVVGSIDDFATKYAVEVRAQEHRKEIIQNLGEMTGNLLEAFRLNTKKVPKRILMYRDGVSESQFAEVLSAEMLKMREACTKLNKNYKPAITFICVQKRHHTRLFCENKQDAAGRAGNVPPGTIVDKDITHPTEIDFYLCSHQGIQGTSRPAHYHVLWDDSDLKPDQLQKITYDLCHVYSRCARSVSIPTPAYYAHWAAFRSKTYASMFVDENTSVYSGGSNDKPSNEVLNITRVSKDHALSNRLYYI